MNAFLAIDPEVFEPEDLAPTPIFAETSGQILRILDAGQCVSASDLVTWRARYKQVLIPGHMCSAFGDYAEGQFDVGRTKYIVALIVARLSELVFGDITAECLNSIKRLARCITSLSRENIHWLIESKTISSASNWVRVHAICGGLMTLALRADSRLFSQSDGLVFAALLHDLDGLVRGEIDRVGGVNEHSITLSVLARHHPVEPIVHEALSQFRERIDGSGGPFGCMGSQVSESAQYLGLLSTVCQNTIHSDLGIEDVLTEIRMGSAGAFEPGLVERLLKVLR